MKNAKLWLVIVVLFLMVGLSVVDAATYYVATNGNDANNGTSTGSPWATIQKATTMVAPGDTVYIKAGTYSGNITLTTSGTSGSPITFEGYTTTPGDNPSLYYSYGDAINQYLMPMLDGGNRATAGTAITMHNRNYIVLKNLQIVNYQRGINGAVINNCIIENIIAKELGDPTAAYDGRGITFGTYANNNIIKRCIVINACAEGILVLGTYNTIENCAAYCDDNRSENAAMDYYIEVVDGDYNTIIGCYAERVGELPHPGHGIQLKGNCENNLIKDSVTVNLGFGFSGRHRGVMNNIFENSTAIGDGGNGLAAIDGASYNTFRNCRTIGVDHGAFFYDTYEDEGTQSAGTYNTFENCIFEDTIYNCIEFNGYDRDSAASYNKFINCTFYDGQYLFNCDRTNVGNEMTNCIVNGVSNYKAGGYTLGCTISYSCFYGNGFSTPTGTGNFAGNPFFQNPANGDFHLREESACIDAGTTVDIDVDHNYLNRLYGDHYDVGAHEYCGEDTALIHIDFNENTGTAVADNMACISNGTISGATWVAGKSGSGLDFDGSNDTVNFGNQAVLDLDGSFSISAWVKPEQNDAYNAIAGKYIWGYYGLYTMNGQLCGFANGSTTDASSSSTATLATGVWSYVVMTFDVNGDKKVHLYINGAEVTYATQTAMVGSPANDSSSYNFYIGSDLGYRYWFNGVIDEVKIFTRALNAQEIDDTYDGMVFSADFEAGNGSNVNDACYGNDGTLTEVINWTEGVSGMGLDFGGFRATRGVNFGDPAILNMTGSRTISAWIKPERYGDYHQIVSKPLTGYSLYVNNGYLNGYIAGSSTPAHSLSSNLVTIGEWQHVAMTFDVNGDKKIRLYINGQEVTYSTQTAMGGSPTSTASNDFVIGYWFDGVIDKVKVFTRAFSAEEINELAGIYATIFCVELDEGTGSSVADSSIYGNDGTVSGASWVGGVSGNALDFDGTNDGVNFGNPTILQLTGSRSVSAWIKPDQNNDYNTIINKGGAYSFLTYAGGYLRGWVMGNSEYADSISNEAIVTGEWQHVAMTFDVNGDKKVHLYINGEEVTYSKHTALTGNPISTAYGFYIGTDQGTSNWFNGIIDEVKIYSKTLTAYEIESLYQAE